MYTFHSQGLIKAVLLRALEILRLLPLMASIHFHVCLINLSFPIGEAQIDLCLNTR